MKKLLIIILFAFIIISIFTIMFTFQMSSTFRDFSDEDEDEDEDEDDDEPENDNHTNSYFEKSYKSIPQEQIKIQTFEDGEDIILIIKEIKWIKRQELFRNPVFLCICSNIVPIFIRSYQPV